jgi:hypothetical protein
VIKDFFYSNFINQEGKMLSSIKQYKLNSKTTKEDLLKAGFQNGGFLKRFKHPKVNYSISLVDDIELLIEIETNTMKFDWLDNLVILDGSFCQPYYPFYKDKKFNFLNKVIKEYHAVMDQFVEKGVFEYV